MTDARPENVQPINVLVVGYGSIGQRHVRLMREARALVSIVSRHANADSGVPVHRSLAAALAIGRPDLVVIATETSRHADDLAALAATGWVGPVLVEKPLLAQPGTIPDRLRDTLFVGYNLRCHPLTALLRDALTGRHVLAAQVSCGQHLETWRPGRGKSQSYSGFAEHGGGVLRDLSHEIDLIAHLFGDWSRLAASGGRLGDVTIDSDDVWSVILNLPSRAPVTLTLDYHHRPARRSIVVQTATGTIEADYIAGRFTLDGVARDVITERDETYRAMHAALAANDTAFLCDAAQGLAVVDTIGAIERAAAAQAWIHR